MSSRNVAFLACLVASCAGPDYNPGNGNTVVGVDEIRKALDDGSSIQVIDVRKEEEFMAGHIPTAKRLWRSDIEDQNSEIDGMRINRSDLEKVLGGVGISDGEPVYLYDAKGNVDAARLWWLLNLYGFHKAVLIDGGYVQWRMRGLPVEEGPALPHQSIFSFLQPEVPCLLAEKDAIRAGHVGQLIDTRSAAEYRGELLKNGALRGGHIPGAVSLDYIELLQGGEYTMKSSREILSLLKERGLDPGKPTIVYCHSGVRSAFTTFVLLEIVKMKDVANYDGSWIEWSGDENCPVELPLEKADTEL